MAAGPILYRQPEPGTWEWFHSPWGKQAMEKVFEYFVELNYYDTRKSKVSKLILQSSGFPCSLFDSPQDSPCSPLDNPHDSPCSLFDSPQDSPCSPLDYPHDSPCSLFDSPQDSPGSPLRRQNHFKINSLVKLFFLLIFVGYLYYDVS